MHKAEQENSYTRLWHQIKCYVRLNIENVKLTVAEKVTILVTAAAISVIALLFSIIVLAFVSVALANLLAEAVGTFWAYMIVAGAYALLFIIIYLLRKPLITNPVARFMTKLFFT